MSKQPDHLLGDFFDRNVMRKADGTYCIVDWEIPKLSLKDLLYEYLLHWANGSMAVFNYLSESMEVSIRDGLRKQASALVQGGKDLPLEADEF